MVLASLTPAVARGQVFEVQGGGSSQYQGYGGALNIWGDGFEGNLGIGYLDGVRFSAFLKRPVGKDTLRLGNDAISVKFTTDVFGSAHTILAQGLGVRRGTKRSQVYAFVGASASATPAPFVNALDHDRVIGVVQAERALSPTLRAVSHGLFSSRQTLLQGLTWKPTADVEAGATAGIGSNQPYASTSFALIRERLDLRASYVGMGSRFRRTGVPSPIQTETDRENLVATFRPAAGFSIGAGRQHFRQDSTLPGAPAEATLNQIFGTARLVGANVAAGVFDARTRGTHNVSSYVTASSDLARWLQADLYLLRVWSPAPVRATTPVLRLREFLSPQLSVLQVITRANDRTSVSFGGAFVAGLTTLGLDYQIVHTPYRPTEPFVQTVALNVRLPIGPYRVTASSFVSADGKVNYAGSASTFFYAGAAGAGGSRPVEIRFERYVVDGVVVDEAGTPIDGAAISIGGTTVFTDSRGRFFVRFATRRAVEVRVDSDAFITDGQYETVSAPPTATPRTEADRTPIRIVLRRVASNGTEGPAERTSART